MTTSRIDMGSFKNLRSKLPDLTDRVDKKVVERTLFKIQDDIRSVYQRRTGILEKYSTRRIKGRARTRSILFAHGNIPARYLEGEVLGDQGQGVVLRSVGLVPRSFFIQPQETALPVQRLGGTAYPMRNVSRRGHSYEEAEEIVDSAVSGRSRELEEDVRDAYSSLFE